jgi:hypothetical protein
VHDGLALVRYTLQPGEKPTVTLTVCNTGTRAGNEVVQLYVHDEASTLIRPPQELKAFAKVTLQPGQTQTVSLMLGMRAFAAYDDVRHALFAKAGRFEVRLGSLSDAVGRMGSSRSAANRRAPPFGPECHSALWRRTSTAEAARLGIGLPLWSTCYRNHNATAQPTIPGKSRGPT